MQKPKSAIVLLLTVNTTEIMLKLICVWLNGDEVAKKLDDRDYMMMWK